MADRLPQVDLYTDGGCRPNPGPGGWAAVVIDGDETPRELAGGEAATTNNRMELTAAVAGLRALDRPHRVRLFTDSEYLRQGVTTWLPGWRANGWRTANKKEVKNQDLWRELERELERHQVTWHWIKGHSGDRWNERADCLAAAAIPRERLPVVDPEAVHLFTAAAYSGKRGVGSWAAVLQFGDREKVVSGQVADTSANRMHLVAALAGLRELRRRVRVHLYTASDYLKDGASSWLAAWRARGWQTRDGRPVAHRDLWLEIDALLRRHQVQWHVVESGDLPEEMQRAKKAAREALGARGSAGDP